LHIVQESCAHSKYSVLYTASVWSQKNHRIVFPSNLRFFHECYSFVWEYYDH